MSGVGAPGPYVSFLATGAQPLMPNLKFQPWQERVENELNVLKTAIPGECGGPVGQLCPFPGQELCPL